MELDTREPEMKDALNDLSARRNWIIGGAIQGCAGKIGAEVEINEIPSLKTLNKLITGTLDKLIAEQIRIKRKDL